eukprot:EG_transcript_382
MEVNPEDEDWGLPDEPQEPPLDAAAAQKIRATRVRLPIVQFRNQILRSVEQHRVTFIQGSTGSGKSTQVPRYLLEAGARRVITTQPTRMAAKALARRVASELGEPVGRTVGYAVSGDRLPGRLTFGTAGYVLSSLLFRPQVFAEYSHLILDEVHQRYIPNDLLLLVAKSLMARYSTKLIVMSATCHLDLICDYLRDLEPNPRPIIIDAPPWPLQKLYLDDLLADTALPAAVARSVSDTLEYFAPRQPNDSLSLRNYVKQLPPLIMDLVRHYATGGCGILVFLPGIADIEKLFDLAMELERGAADRGVRIKVFALHSLLHHQSMSEVFREPGPDTCHLIFASSIAESSLTLPNVSLVIDCGVEQTSSSDSQRAGVARLVAQWCSRSSLQQRAGRAGRTGPGRCIRLFPRAKYDELNVHDHSDFFSQPLSSTYLSAHILASRLNDGSTAEDVLQQLIYPPPPRLFAEVRQQLLDCGALLDNPSGGITVTALGQVMLKLPFGQEMCQLLWLGGVWGCMADAVVLTAAQLISDPFTVPSKMVMKDNKLLREAMARSTAARYALDRGHYSELLMLRNLYVEWWHWKRERPESQNTLVNVFSAKFALSPRLMLGFLRQVESIALRMQTICNQKSVIGRQLQELTAAAGSGVPPFTSRPELLRCLLVSVQAQNLLVATAGETSRWMKTFIQQSGLDAQRTVCFKLAEPHSPADLREALRVVSAVPCTQLLEKRKTAFVELATQPAAAAGMEVKHTSPPPFPLLSDVAPSVVLLRQFFETRPSYTIHVSGGQKVTLPAPWVPGVLRFRHLTPGVEIPTLLEFRQPLAMACDAVGRHQLFLACCASTLLSTAGNSSITFGATLLPLPCIHFLLMSLNAPIIPVSVGYNRDSEDLLAVILRERHHVNVEIPGPIVRRTRRLRNSIRAAARVVDERLLEEQPAIASEALALAELSLKVFPKDSGDLTGRSSLDDYLASLPEDPTPTFEQVHDPKEYFHGASPAVQRLAIRVIRVMDRDAHTVPEVNHLLQKQGDASEGELWAAVPDRFDFGVMVSGLVRVDFFRKFPRLFSVSARPVHGGVTVKVTEFGLLVPEVVSLEPVLPADVDGNVPPKPATTPTAPVAAREAAYDVLVRAPTPVRQLLFLVLAALEEAGACSLEQLNEQLRSVPQYQSLPLWDYADLWRPHGITAPRDVGINFFGQFPRAIARTTVAGGTELQLAPHGRELLEMCRQVMVFDPVVQARMYPRPLVKDRGAVAQMLKLSHLSDADWLDAIPSTLQTLLIAVAQTVGSSSQTIRAINADTHIRQLAEPHPELQPYGVGAGGALLVKFFRRLPRVFRCGEARAHGTVVRLTEFGLTLAPLATPDTEWFEQLPEDFQRLLISVVSAISQGCATILEVNADKLVQASIKTINNPRDYGIGSRGVLLVKFFRELPRLFVCGEAQARDTAVHLTEFGRTLSRKVAEVDAGAPATAVNAVSASEPIDMPVPASGSLSVKSYAEQQLLAYAKRREEVKERAREAKRARSRGVLDRLRAARSPVS